MNSLKRHVIILKYYIGRGMPFKYFSELVYYYKGGGGGFLFSTYKRYKNYENVNLIMSKNVKISEYSNFEGTQLLYVITRYIL